jgi:hypothetical protein
MVMTAINRTELRNNVLDGLVSLGNDAAQVAGRLREVGVRADPGDGGDCPVAVYLSAFIAGHDCVRSLHVTGKCVIIWFTKGWQLQLLVALPLAVRSFIANFDRGAYPELTWAPAHTGTEQEVFPG